MDKIFISQVKLLKKLEEAGFAHTHPTVIKWTRSGMPFYNLPGTSHNKYVWEEVLAWLINTPEEKKV